MTILNIKKCKNECYLTLHSDGSTNTEKKSYSIHVVRTSKESQQSMTWSHLDQKC